MEENRKDFIPGWHGYSKKVLSSNPTSAWSLHVLPVSAWVFPGYASFPPQSKDMHIRLSGDSKLPVSVSLNGCLCIKYPAVKHMFRNVMNLPLKYNYIRENKIPHKAHTCFFLSQWVTDLGREAGMTSRPPAVRVLHVCVACVCLACMLLQAMLLP